MAEVLRVVRVSLFSLRSRGRTGRGRITGWSVGFFFFGEEGVALAFFRGRHLPFSGLRLLYWGGEGRYEYGDAVFQ